MTGQELPSALQAVIPIVDNYGYLAVGGLLLLENFGLPVPGETTLIVAAVLAGTGSLNIFTLILVAIVCCVVGDSIGYIIGLFGGEVFLKKYGKYFFITDERLEKMQRFFKRWGPEIVVGARFIEGLRQLNGIFAGINEMKYRKFLVFNIIGATLWVGLWAGAGYFAGDNIGAIYRMVTSGGIYILGLLLVILLAWLIRLHLKRRKSRRQKGN